MTRTRIALAAVALALPLASAAGSADAASAHNLQSGAHTSNAADTARTAYLKQIGAYHEPDWQYQESGEDLHR